jgi:uncharacterized protein YjbI with pentapeptide repeats
MKSLRTTLSVCALTATLAVAGFVGGVVLPQTGQAEGATDTPSNCNYIPPTGTTTINWTNCFIGGINMVGLDLHGANLTRVRMVHSNLTGAYFANVKLISADMRDTNLTSANLANSDLSGAILSNARLTNTSLSNSNLTNAKMSNTLLAGADLKGANLTGVTGSPSFLGSFRSSTTTCPNGMKYGTSGANC